MGTTVRDSVFKLVCKVPNFAIKFELWIKQNVTGRFFYRLRSYAPQGGSRLRLVPIAKPIV